MVIKESFGKDGRTDDLLAKCVALYVGKSNCCVFGRVGYIFDDRNAKAVRIRGRAFVPYGFIERSFSLPLSEELRVKEKSCDYSNLEDVCRHCGLWLHEEENGLCIISREDLSSLLDWGKNMKLMRNVAESFVFDDVSGEELLRLIKQRYSENKHPRLIFTKEKLKKIKDGVGRDRVYTALVTKLLEMAEGFLAEKPSSYELRDGIRLGYVCQENSGRMMTLALAYNLSGDIRYAERACEEIRASVEFPDFNPYHFLDVGEMCLGLGLAYDWLYGYMTEELRASVRDAIVKKGIYPINEDFDELPRRRSWNWRGELADNWRLVITGVGVGALSVLDELEGTDLIKAERAAEQTLYDIRRALSLFAPRGAYEEGHAYWYFGMKYFCYFMSCLISAVGDDFGYVDCVGMRMTNQYLLAMNGSVSTFDYHDCDRMESNVPPETMFLAGYFGNYGEALPRIKRILENSETEACKVISDLYAYDAEGMSSLAESSCVSIPDVCLPVAEVASMRTGVGREDLWLGFHCDDPIGGEGHDHMDSGNFVLDALGESFFFDLGKDDYNLPDYLNCYRVRDEGHNVIVFNPDADYSMAWGGRAKIVDFYSSEGEAYAIGDLGGAYRSDFEIISYRRLAALDKLRKFALIQDEFKLGKRAQALWFAHTRAEISLSEDGREAVLEQNGKRLFARIIKGAGAKFSVMAARPLPASPVIEGQNTNPGVRKLTVCLDGVSKAELCVAFFTDPHCRTEFKTIDEWKKGEKSNA